MITSNFLNSSTYLLIFWQISKHHDVHVQQDNTSFREPLIDDSDDMIPDSVSGSSGAHGCEL